MPQTDAQIIMYEQLARIAKSLSNPNRIQILDVLSQGERSVEQLAEETGLTVKNTSAQLRVLRNSHLIESRKQGQFAIYRLVDESVARFVLSLRDFAESRLAEMREVATEVLGDGKRLDPVGRRKLLARARKGEVTVIDVRAESDYEAGHIPGARSIPFKQLEQALQDIPKDTEVVAYCRGPLCVLASEAVTLLREQGFQATHLHEGIVDWKAAGLPVETGSGQ